LETNSALQHRLVPLIENITRPNPADGLEKKTVSEMEFFAGTAVQGKESGTGSTSGIPDAVEKEVGG